MKRSSKHLKYEPGRKRRNLDATAYGPALKILFALILLAAFALAVIFFVVPFVRTQAESGWPLFSRGEAQAALETPEPLNPILLNSVKTIRFGEGDELPAAVVDPSVFAGEILFATGDDENACDRLIRLDPATGAYQTVSVTREYDTIRYPLENASAIFYVDFRLDGGGVIRMLSKITGESTELAAFALDAPRLVLETPYLAWMEHTGTASGKLIVCDILSGETVTLAVFSNSSYAESAPSIRSGQILYADADTANPGASLIRTMLLSDGSRWDYSAGVYVHDPKSAGDRWAFLCGNHDGESDLYVSVQGGASTRIARGVVDFGITPYCVVYSRDESVYAYAFSDNKTYVLSETGTNSQFVSAGGEYAIWRDMTNPDQPVWKYIRVVE